MIGFCQTVVLVVEHGWRRWRIGWSAWVGPDPSVIVIPVLVSTTSVPLILISVARRSASSRRRIAPIGPASTVPRLVRSSSIVTAVILPFSWHVFLDEGQFLASVYLVVNFVIIFLYFLVLLLKFVEVRERYIEYGAFHGVEWLHAVELFDLIREVPVQNAPYLPNTSQFLRSVHLEGHLIHLARLE